MWLFLQITRELSKKLEEILGKPSADDLFHQVSSFNWWSTMEEKWSSTRQRLPQRALNTILEENLTILHLMPLMPLAERWHFACTLAEPGSGSTQSIHLRFGLRGTLTKVALRNPASVVMNSPSWTGVSAIATLWKHIVYVPTMRRPRRPISQKCARSQQLGPSLCPLPSDILHFVRVPHRCAHIQQPRPPAHHLRRLQSV
ncbi:hypothetical protein BC830DRAFT_425516 [Chytriomyces sp. MP71]|nr:hypothetical protein BC830DRAFT_425516 [Chytriomyces sp. MP71]